MQLIVDSPFDLFQAVLTSDDPDFETFCGDLVSMKARLSALDWARSKPLARVAQALARLDSSGGTSDIAVLVRQIIRSHQRSLQVPLHLWHEVLSSHEEEVGLRAVGEFDPGVIEVKADPWCPSWLTRTEEIDLLELRRHDISAVGDPGLFVMAGWTRYQSAAQKAAVDACLFASPGSTTLVNLPTGAGKSLCMLVPAWLDSNGGRRRGGTTLVVVPTVALALDQKRQADEFFRDSNGDESAPASWTGDTPPSERTTIYNGIRNGTLPILYTSPESLMQSGLYTACLGAARRGTLTRLIVDEAHIVETWGAGFRSEFQFLSAYRSKLLAVSKGQLRTTLLSATMSEKSVDLLRTLFAEAGNFVTVQANRLRPEPSYWFNYTDDPESREERVLEALFHLPRPAILYVTRPMHAAEWVQLLRNRGFKRVSAFSGDTQRDERDRLIKEWSNDERDIMVATSAFGLGVDKSDVRTVVHACLPEDADRFYQEVGRGGRDGCSSISLVCITKVDEQLAFGMISTNRITPTKALSRWRGLRSSQQFLDGRGDTVRVDLNAVPEHDPDMGKNVANHEWNEHTLLLMQRAGMLKVLDTRSEDQVQDVPSMTNEVDTAAWLPLRILQPDLVNIDEQFEAAIGITRDAEASDIKSNLQHLRGLIARYTDPLASDCLAHELGALYPGTILACGGCAACRRRGRSPYSYPLPLEMSQRGTQAPPDLSNLNPELRNKIGQRSVLHITWDGPRNLLNLENLNSLLVDLLQPGGFQQLILPDNLAQSPVWARALLTNLGKSTSSPQIILPQSWLANHHKGQLFSLPTVAVYPPQDDAADEFHMVFAAHWATLPPGVPLINVVHSNIYLESEHGTFLNRINGLHYSIARVQSWLSTSVTADWF